MEILGDVILERDLDKKEYKGEFERESARGIVEIDGKYMMIFSKFHNDLTFPGGGLEQGESLTETLVREMEEEAGIIVKNIRPYCKVVEHHLVPDGRLMKHTSNYFLCDLDSYTKTKLCDYEIEFGYEAKLVSLDEAIELDLKKLNDKSITDYNGVMERELRVLYKLKNDR